MEKVISNLPKGRAQLVRVLAKARDVIRVDDVVESLQLDRIAAAQRLSRWTGQGWLRRVGRGAYVPAALETLDTERVLDDPWVLVPALFAPAYVGGRTAAEHWDLTEQIFKDVVVLTTQAVREKHQVRQGMPFSLKHVDEKTLFGLVTIWRRQTRVFVSDVHRTVIDMMDDPQMGGGIQHVGDCLAAYLRRDDKDETKLIEYAKRLGNGAVFKRLGFLAERTEGGANLAEYCAQHLSGGHAQLDPAQPGDRVVTRWRLRVPATWAREGSP